VTLEEKTFEARYRKAMETKVELKGEE